MAEAKEIRTRMESIENTRKITNAMYLISSSKLRGAKEKLKNTEPYFFTLQNAIERLLRHAPDIEHRYLENEEKQPRAERSTRGMAGYLIVTADKGLAGAFNQNVLKLAQRQMEFSGESRFFVVGQVGRSYFDRRGYPYDIHFQYTIQKPSIHRARIIAETLLEQYRQGEIHEIHMIYTERKNSMESEAKMKQLLPLRRPLAVPVSKDIRGKEISYEPSPEQVLDHLVPNYVAGFIYSALVESYASEQNARMTAMESATGSADDMLKKLSMQYNRMRQASITQEITEIASGARALGRR